MTTSAMETMTTWIEARGGPVPDLTDASFIDWLNYWYGASDGEEGRSARALLYADLEPVELWSVLQFRPWLVTNDPAEYQRLREAFSYLFWRWVDELNEQQAAQTTERQA